MNGHMRFVAASCVSSQRWVAPVLLFAVAAATLFASGGSPLTNFGVGAALLFPIAAWITVATLNDEDPSQHYISAAVFGSTARLRRSKLAVATSLSLGLAAVSILVASVRGEALTIETLAAASLGHLLTVVGGVAVGAVCSRPLVARNGSALLLIGGATLADVVLPDAPPVHLVLSALSGGHAPRWTLLALATLATVSGASALFALSGRLAGSAG